MNDFKSLQVSYQRLELQHFLISSWLIRTLKLYCNIAQTPKEVQYRIEFFDACYLIELIGTPRSFKQMEQFENQAKIEFTNTYLLAFQSKLRHSFAIVGQRV